jgi:hypothetical protein
MSMIEVEFCRPIFIVFVLLYYLPILPPLWHGNFLVACTIKLLRLRLILCRNMQVVFVTASGIPPSNITLESK